MKSINLIKISRALSIAILVIFASTAYASEEEKRTSLEDQKSVAVTIYNENLALIKDQRTITLDKGFNLLAFRGVSAKMRPETALLRNLNNAGLNVIEQNFDFDLLTPQKLLEKYVGKQVKIATMNPATGVETIEQATVLSTNQGVVVQIGDRIETNPRGRLIYDKVPENLRDQPTLVIQLNSATSKAQDVELSYLSSGLSWKADYVAELNAKDNKLDLIGWVTLNNKSGTSYNNAKLQLVAGDVNVVKNDFGRQLAGPAMRMEKAMVMEDSAMQEESLFEYHLYSLNRPTAISNNQTKQVSLLTATQVPVTKEFLLQGNNYYYRSSYGNLGQKIKVGVYVEFKNKKKSGLGLPMPKGVVRVYKKDKSGNAQFIGEDNINHTPKNEDVRLKLGDAFDITADKKQTNSEKRVAFGKYSHAYESTYEIKIKNAKSETVTVVVREPIPGDWKMTKESHKFKKIASGTAEWHIEVPAESSTTLEYSVLVRY
ncbi:MAG TPA: DUF4139 domain-containing protein [Thiotrichaceae bacterium]|jgi:hypothetical protein|nr:DUF4139 domain-containing protein [Thiotrichaceae bacterium]HIM08798.1 DUF4139 domain-containing protein [Gammaproteobacteria bacterium]